MIREFDFLIADEPLSRHTSFKIGGPADLFAQPSNKDQLVALVRRAQQLNIPVYVFGSGTNLLISDKGIRGLSIFTRKMTSGIHVIDSDKKQTSVLAGAGDRLASLCRFANENGLSGIEFAAGIPGTLGGALMMNAGTPDGRMADILVSMDVLDLSTMAVTTIARKDLAFSYRHLNLKELILSACFVLHQGDPKTVKETYDRHLEAKRTSQPVSDASAGCYFKNPVNAAPAGKLIEDAGLKGRQVNDAQVSDIHANYIINLGKATCQDVLSLQKIIQQTIYEKYQIQLETEVRVQGDT